MPYNYNGLIFDLYSYSEMYVAKSGVLVLYNVGFGPVRAGLCLVAFHSFGNCLTKPYVLFFSLQDTDDPNKGPLIDSTIVLYGEKQLEDAYLSCTVHCPSNDQLNTEKMTVIAGPFSGKSCFKSSNVIHKVLNYSFLFGSKNNIEVRINMCFRFFFWNS